MNTMEYIRVQVFPDAFVLLPGHMDTVEARAMLLAIGMQESRFIHRRQIGGPAMGFWQFESGGGWRGVLNHPDTKELARSVLHLRGYSTDPGYQTLSTDDVIACCFARLLLWTLPMSLPKRGDAEEGWRQYIEAWRPGRPHRETWDAFYQQAWDAMA